MRADSNGSRVEHALACEVSTHQHQLRPFSLWVRRSRDRHKQPLGLQLVTVLFWIELATPGFVCWSERMLPAVSEVVCWGVLCSFVSLMITHAAMPVSTHLPVYLSVHPLTRPSTYPFIAAALPHILLDLLIYVDLQGYERG